jgi:hypothetical protein
MLGLPDVMNFTAFPAQYSFGRCIGVVLEFEKAKPEPKAGELGRRGTGAARAACRAAVSTFAETIALAIAGLQIDGSGNPAYL